MSTRDTLSSRPAPVTASARRMPVFTGAPVGPASAVALAGALLALYVMLAARSVGIEGPGPVIFVLVTAGVFLAWLASANGLLAPTDTTERTDRLTRRALPFLAFFPAGVLAPEFIFGSPGAGRVALVLGTCLLLFVVLHLHAAGRTAAVVAWIERRAGVLLVAVIAVHLVATTALVIIRHHYFNAILGEDTAYYNQIFWSTLHGEFFRGSLTQARYTNPPISSEFGAHNSPILFLLVPAYWVHPSFYTLLVLRNVALSLSAIPLFLLARGWLGGAVGLGVAVVHLLGPNLLSQSMNAFYPMQFAVLLLPLAFLAFERARLGWFVAAFVLVLSVREELALTAILFAGYALVRRRSWRWVITPALVAAAWWYVSTVFVMLPSRIAMEDLEAFYTAFPDGFRGAVGRLLRHPVEFLRVLVTTDTVAYLYQLAKWTMGLGLATAAVV